MHSVSAALLLGSSFAAQAYAAPAGAGLSVGFTAVAPKDGSSQPFDGSHLLMNGDANAGAPKGGNTNGAKGGASFLAGNNLAAAAATGNKNLEIVFENNGEAKSLTAYIIGKQQDGTFVMVKSDGSFWKAQKGDGKPITEDIAIKIDDKTKSIKLPDFLISARAYVSEEPLKFLANADGTIGTPAPQTASDANAGVNYGFAEFNSSPDSLFANPSAVDVIGLPLGLKIEGSKTQEIPGPPSDVVQLVCDDLKKANKDNAPWAKLCQQKDGKPIRVVAPHFQPDDFKDYFTEYVDKVFSQVKQFTVKSTDQKTYTCKVAGAEYDCGAAGKFGKPTAKDIFGCDSGPFSTQGASDPAKFSQPAICAAWNRGTWLLDGGDNQPAGVKADKYYTTEPSNIYSKAVHAHEADGKGYGFAYDDVSPEGSNTAGAISEPNPKKFTISAGGTNAK